MYFSFEQNRHIEAVMARGPPPGAGPARDLAASFSERRSSAREPPVCGGGVSRCILYYSVFSGSGL